MDDKFQTDARVARLAKIFCNVALFCGIVLLIFGLMPVIRFFYYLIILIFVAAVIVAWLMSWLIIHPFDISFISPLFDQTNEAFAYIQEYTFKCAPYFCAVAVVFGIIGIVLITRDKSVKKTGRIVAASLGIGFAVVGTVASILEVVL